jgi:hypothetical protein
VAAVLPAVHVNPLTIWSHMNFARWLFHVLVRAPTGLDALISVPLDTQRSVPLPGVIVVNVTGVHFIIKATIVLFSLKASTADHSACGLLFLTARHAE